MGFFKRRNEQPIDEPFVETEAGWRLLQEVVNQNWEGLAAAAWAGYQQDGRGVLWADFVSYDFRFAGLDVVRGVPEWREVLKLCQQYDAQRQVVFMTRVTRGRGRNVHLSDFMSLLDTPRGSMSPPEALNYLRGVERMRAGQQE